MISPVAPGIFIGHYRGWLGLLRLDHQINDRNNLFFRSNVDGFHDTNPNGAVGGNSLPTVDRVFRRRTYSEELGETAVLTPSVLNNVRLQFQLASPITEFDPVINGTQYPGADSAAGHVHHRDLAIGAADQPPVQVNDTLSATWGRHQVRFGVDVMHAHTGGNSKEFGGPIYLGQFVYNTCTQALADLRKPELSRQHRQRGQLYAELWQRRLHRGRHAVVWFVQDDIRLRPDLTVNLGLRYEQQTFTDSRKDFAPRVGFATTSSGDGKTVIRGGFGIYYSQIVDNSAGQLRAYRTDRRVQLHGGAGPDRIPDQHCRSAPAGLSRRARQRRCAASISARATTPISTSFSPPPR